MTTSPRSRPRPAPCKYKRPRGVWVVLAIIAALFLLIVGAKRANAQLGFVTGMMLGSAMSGDSSDGGGGGNGDVLYRAPGLAQRGIDWKTIQLNSTCVMAEQLWQSFQRVAKNPHQWEVLEIRRVHIGNGNHCLWFAFIAVPPKG